MLAKALSYTKANLAQNSGLVAFTKRGVYKAGTEPKVFVNKNTRVICQGITGKHVSTRKNAHSMSLCTATVEVFKNQSKYSSSS